MKITITELVEKVADNLTMAADIGVLMEVFKDNQVSFLEGMTEPELIEYASEILGYDVDEEL